MCNPCKEGNHEACLGEGCSCETKIDTMTQLAIEAASRNEVIHASMIYDHLMSAHTGLARMFTDGVGPDAVRAFVAQVLQSRKALMQ